MVPLSNAPPKETIYSPVSLVPRAIPNTPACTAPREGREQPRVLRRVLACPPADTVLRHLRAADAMKNFSEFRQEASTLHALQHPCIVALIGISIHPLGFALELAPLGSLNTVLAENAKGRAAGAQGDTWTGQDQGAGQAGPMGGAGMEGGARPETSGRGQSQWAENAWASPGAGLGWVGGARVGRRG